jgi:hypothetical protein
MEQSSTKNGKARRWHDKKKEALDSDTLFVCKCEEDDLFQRGALELCYLACKIQSDN